MSSFAVLNDEQKIQRRKEKEKERKQKIEERIAEVNNTPCAAKWADESDEDGEIDAKLLRPVSDSESEASHEDEENEPPPPPVVPAQISKVQEESVKPQEITAAPTKSKKDRKKEKLAKDDEDFDDILTEFGVKPGETVLEGAASSRRRKKKEKDGQAVTDDAKDKDKVEAAEKPTSPSCPPKTEKAEEATDEATVDEAARQAAIEALKKKQANKGSKNSSSDAAKCAAAEAKKRTANQKKKTDKSMYDR